MQTPRCKFCGQSHTQTKCNEENHKACYFFRTRSFIFDYDNQQEKAQVAQQKPREIALVLGRKLSGKLSIKECRLDKATKVEVGKNTVKIVFAREAVDFSYEDG